MTPKKILKHCERRIPFSVMRSILKNKNMVTHAGWSNTINAYEDKMLDDASFIPKVLSLENDYKQHLLSGEKIVSIYKISDDIKDDVNGFIDGFDFNHLSDENCIYKNNYPFPLNDLSKVDDKVKLVYCSKKQGELLLGFCSTRKVEEHVKLNISELRASIQQDFSEYKELFGTKNYRRQLFDFVIIDVSKGYVEYRVDASNYLSFKDQIKSLQRLKSKFLTMLHGSTVDENKLVAHNLFPKIEQLYESNEGRVCELAFTVDTGGSFHERMRNKDIDIRNEDFHSAGMEAVERINAYKIGIEWQKELGNDDHIHKLELLLISSMREITNLRPTLFNAHILKCFNVAQYNELLSKIL